MFKENLNFKSSIPNYFWMGLIFIFLQSCTFSGSIAPSATQLLGSNSGSTQPLGSFTVSGVTGVFDNTADGVLQGVPGDSTAVPTLTWTSSLNASSYDVTIYASNGSTVVCATQNTTANSLAMTGCNLSLTTSATYKAKVTAKNANSLDATNSLYSFTANALPLVYNRGAWYTMAATSITMNVLSDDPATGPSDAIADPDGAAVSVTGFTNGSNGTVTNLGSGNLRYDPAVGFTGTDTYTYTVTDSTGVAQTANVTIRVMTAFSWIGKVSSTWGTTGNWCGSINMAKTGCVTTGVAPSSTATASHIAIFDNACVDNCNPNIAANVNVYEMRIKSSFAGTITQGSGFTITTGLGGWNQAGGTFQGSSGATPSDNITMDGNFALSGGTFTATAGHIVVQKSWAITGGTFNANLGTVLFSSGYLSLTVNGGNANYYGVTFGGSGCTSWDAGTNVMNVYGSFILNETCGAYMNGGTYNLYGPILLTQMNFDTVKPVMKIVGSGPQTVTGAAAGGFGKLVIQSTGSVNFVGTVNVMSDYTYTSGTLNFGTSTLNFKGDYTDVQLNPGSVDYGNVSFNNSACTAWHLNNGTWEIKGTLTFNDCGYLDQGTINSYSDVVFTQGIQDTANLLPALTLNIVGSGTRTISGTTSGFFPHVVVNAVGGTVNLSGSLVFSRNYTYTAGTLNAGTSTVLFGSADFGTHYAIPGNSNNYYNVTMTDTGGVSRDLQGGTLNVTNSFVLNDTNLGTLDNGTVNVLKNMNAVSFGGGTATIQIVGTGSQAINGATAGALPNVVINNASVSSISLTGTITIRRNFTYLDGNFNFGASVLNFMGNGGCGTDTLKMGAMLWGNINFNGTCGNFDLDGGTVLIGGNVVFADTTGGQINNGTLNLYGNFTNSSKGKSGNATVNFTGVAVQTWNQDNSNADWPSNLVIDKSGGSLSMILTSRVRGAWTSGGSVTNMRVKAGTLNFNSAGLTLQGFGAATLLVDSGATINKNSGTISSFIITNSGTINP